jgi:hypothetical protein
MRLKNKLGCGSSLTALLVASLIAAGPAAALQETKLYNTGPDQISGYVRFVNAASGPVSISTGGTGKLELGMADGERIGRFQAVPARQKLAAQVRAGDRSGEVEITVDPDEFVTLAVFPDATTLALRDKPQDFNALKADIAFFNADPGCAGGVMRAGQKKAVVFSGIAPGALARRSVNPVKAVIEAACGETSAGTPVDLGTLNAGGRYSLIVIPDGAGGHRLIGTEDQRAKY